MIKPIIEMKLSSIRTQSEFDEFADNWYQRTKKLAYAMHDRTKPKEYRTKAYDLWLQMFQRMQHIFKAYTRMRSAVYTRNIGNYPSGSAIVGNNNSKEPIIKP